MDFSLTEEQRDVQELASKMLADHADNERLKQLEQAEDRFDSELWQALADAGLLGLAVDAAHGGMGYGFETLCLLVEEVGRSMAPVPVVSVLVESAMVLAKFGSEQQKNELLAALVAGKLLLSAALIEPDNEDSTQPATTATGRAQGGYTLDGAKHCVPLAHRAERILVAARGEQGPVLVLLDPGAAGVAVKPQLVTSGEQQYQLLLEGVEVAPEAVVAEGEIAAHALRYQQQHSQAAMCAMAVGLTDRMTRMSAEYTSQREQFGRQIATFQAVAHRAADCYIDVECLRLVTQQAVAQLQSGQDAAEAVQVAKIWCGDVTHRVSQAAQHMHGGIGVDRDYPLFRYCLWARQLELSLGSSASLTASLGEAIASQLQA